MSWGDAVRRAGEALDEEGFFAAIEIPDGRFTKYEVDGEPGQIFVDRFQSMPVVYPANYGSIPQSEGGDGDPLRLRTLMPGRKEEIPRPLGARRALQLANILRHLPEVRAARKGR